MLIKDKKIIVTGASKGIGLAVSEKIASEGGTVIMFARNSNNLKSAILKLKEKYNTEHHYYFGDVGVTGDVNLFAKWVKNKFGNIHGLVNCAGVYGPIGKTTDLDIEDFSEAININFLGTVYMCMKFSDIFSSEFRKKIVNFSGGGASNAFPNYSAYATSKISIVRFTENLAIELADQNFDINCIAPGFVATDLHKNTLKAGPENAGNFYDNTLKQLENSVSPELAAELVVFLLSDESNGISGKLISAPWDNWKDKEFQELLKKDKDFATLRRIDNKTYFKK